MIRCSFCGCVATSDDSIVVGQERWCHRCAPREIERMRSEVHPMIYVSASDARILIEELRAEIERLQNRMHDFAKMLTVARSFCTIRKCMNCDGYHAKGYLCSCGWDSSGSTAKVAGEDDV